MSFGAEQQSAIHGVTSMQVGIVMGVFGGITIAYYGYTHLFVEGMSDKERNGLLLASGAVLGVYGLKYLFDVDEKWLTVEGLAEQAKKAVAP